MVGFRSREAKLKNSATVENHPFVVGTSVDVNLLRQP